VGNNRIDLGKKGPPGGSKTGPRGSKNRANLGPRIGGLFGNLSGFTVENNRITWAKKGPNLGPRGAKNRAPWGQKTGPRSWGNFEKFIRVRNGKQQNERGRKGRFSDPKNGREGRIPGLKMKKPPEFIGKSNGARGKKLLA